MGDLSSVQPVFTATDVKRECSETEIFGFFIDFSPFTRFYCVLATGAAETSYTSFLVVTLCDSIPLFGLQLLRLGGQPHDRMACLVIYDLSFDVSQRAMHDEPGAIGSTHDFLAAPEAATLSGRGFLLLDAGH